MCLTSPGVLNSCWQRRWVAASLETLFHTHTRTFKMSPHRTFAQHFVAVSNYDKGGCCLICRFTDTADAAVHVMLQVESFWLSDTLSVPTVAPSSKAGSTCASAGHSRTSSIQGLPAAVTSAGQEVLLGPGSLASAADEGVVVSGGGVSSAGHVGGGSISGSSCVDPLAANTDTAQEGELVGSCRCTIAKEMPVRISLRSL